MTYSEKRSGIGKIPYFFSVRPAAHVSYYRPGRSEKEAYIVLLNLLRQQVKDERMIQMTKRYLKSGVAEAVKTASYSIREAMSRDEKYLKIERKMKSVFVLSGEEDR